MLRVVHLMPILHTKSVFKAWLDKTIHPHIILFKARIHTLFIGKANILKFLVFQNLDNFRQADQNIKRMHVIKKKRKKLASLWPSHCDEIKDILLTLFSSLTPCNCMDLTRKLPKTPKHCHNVKVNDKERQSIVHWYLKCRWIEIFVVVLRRKVQNHSVPDMFLIGIARNWTKLNKTATSKKWILLKGIPHLGAHHWTKHSKRKRFKKSKSRIQWKGILHLGKQPMLQLDNQESGKEFWPLVQKNSTLFHPDDIFLENLSHPAHKANANFSARYWNKDRAFCSPALLKCRKTQLWTLFRHHSQF